jgi:hypothetical protein
MIPFNICSPLKYVSLTVDALTYAIFFGEGIVYLFLDSLI